MAPDNPDTDFIFGLTGNSVPPMYCTTPWEARSLSQIRLCSDASNWRCVVEYKSDQTTTAQPTASKIIAAPCDGNLVSSATAGSVSVSNKFELSSKGRWIAMSCKDKNNTSGGKLCVFFSSTEAFNVGKRGIKNLSVNKSCFAVCNYSSRQVSQWQVS